MVPVVLLTGFLGSGKTTLLNRLMERKPDTARRLAIIVNELGDVGIDGSLLPASKTRQIELPGGCICCVLNEDLDKTILELLAVETDLEMIVIETTGIAEPMPIAWSFDREPLSHEVRLAAVLTVVDALEFAASRPLSPSVESQVEYADILVVSKTDLVEPAVPPTTLVDALRALNGSAPIIYGDVVEIVDRLWSTLSDPSLESHARGREQVESTHAHSSTPHGFQTLWLPIEHTLDFEELEEQLEQLPANYVRIKGIARVVDASTGSSEPFVVAFHRVGTRVSCEPLHTPAPTRIVALGPGIERAPLAACLAASVVRCGA